MHIYIVLFFLYIMRVRYVFIKTFLNLSKKLICTIRKTLSSSVHSRRGNWWKSVNRLKKPNFLHVSARFRFADERTCRQAKFDSECEHHAAAKEKRSLAIGPRLPAPQLRLFAKRLSITCFRERWWLFTVCTHVALAFKCFNIGSEVQLRSLQIVYLAYIKCTGSLPTTGRGQGYFNWE